VAQGNDEVGADQASRRRRLGPIRLFVPGGTFDKEYDEFHGTLDFRDTHLNQMLELGRCRLDVKVRTLMMVDSLEMTDGDRGVIASNCSDAPEPPIVITHGTDTMVDTARAQQLSCGSGLSYDRYEPVLNNKLLIQGATPLGSTRRPDDGESNEGVVGAQWGSRCLIASTSLRFGTIPF